MLVVEEDARVLGWASLSQDSDRAADSRTVEISVYVAEDARGKGVGRSLMKAIVEEARWVDITRSSRASPPTIP